MAGCIPPAPTAMLSPCTASSGLSLSHGGWPQKGTGPPVSQPWGPFPRQPPAGLGAPGGAAWRGVQGCSRCTRPSPQLRAPPPRLLQPPALTRAGLSLVS